MFSSSQRELPPHSLVIGTKSTCQHHCCEYNVSFSAGIPDGINVKLGVVLTVRQPLPSALYCVDELRVIKAVLTFLTHW